MSSYGERVIPLTPVIRKKASLNIWTTKDELFDMDFLFKSLNQIVVEHETTGDMTPLFTRLRQIDLIPFFKQVDKLNTFFQCTFFGKRFGWISKNNSGEYRYFSKIKEGNGFYAFDLFDLLTIVLNMSSKALIRYLQESYPFGSFSEWCQMESDKYEENVSMLHPKELAQTPFLQRVLRDGVDILEAFMSFGKSKVNGKHLSDGNHSVFFLSVQHFKEQFFQKKSISTLNQWINLFAVLGLIEKTANVPIELQLEAEKQQTLKRKHNHVSFYIVPSFKSVLDIAELRAKELFSHRISYHQLTKEIVLSVFGRGLHDHVYIQKTHGRRKKEKKTKLSIEWIETFFSIELSEKGTVSKKDFMECSPLSRKTLEEAWNRLLHEHHCERSVPNSLEIERYGWGKRQRVARKITSEHVPSDSETSFGVTSDVWNNNESLPLDFFDSAIEILAISS